MIDIEEIVSKEYSVPFSRIAIEGDEGYSYTISNLSDTRRTLTVSLSGAKSVIEGLDAGDISLSLNVSGLDEGEYDMPVDIEPIEDLEADEEAYLHVVVSYDEEEDY